MSAPKVQIPALRPRLCPSTSNESERSVNEDVSTPRDDGKGRGKAKLGRTSKPKVRTGCLTCKIRRIKCDEAKPACTRCTSTGRTCDGYAIPIRTQPSESAHQRSVASAPEPCLDVVRGTPAELSALEFFHRYTAPAVSGYFDADFWTGLALQMGHAEPAIRHAMVVVGSLHRRRELASTEALMMRSSASYEPSALCSRQVVKSAHASDDRFALAQYNKAIGHLTERLRDPEAGPAIVLLTCILFICIEFLQGDVAQVIAHFRGGLSIALVAASRRRSGLEHMLPFFNRLELLCTLFGNQVVGDYPVALLQTVPDAFGAMSEARDSLVHLLNLGLRFIHSVELRKYEHQITSDDLVRVQALRSQVNKWEAAFDTFLLDPKTTTPRDLDAAKVLRIHQLVLLLWLGASVRNDESWNDTNTLVFQTAIELGEALQARIHTSKDAGPMHSTTFLFDMETVSPLYYVAVKCRHPQLRRRVIALLRQTVRREGLWDSYLLAAVAERVMELEERALTVFDGSELPGEQWRVHNTQIESVAGVNAALHTLTIYTKPQGLAEDFIIWQETLELDASRVV